MAGEPLLNSAELGVVLIDEPAARAVRIPGFDEACHMALAIGRVAGCPLLDLRARTQSGAPFLIDDPLCDQIAGLQRRSLLLCGRLLEGALTQIALNTLLQGYNVFVPADLALSAETGREPLFLGRIASCGGFILTRRQIVLELLSYERDAARREGLEALL